MHAYINTYTHTNIHEYTHTHTVHTHVYTHTYTHIHTHTYKHCPTLYKTRQYSPTLLYLFHAECMSICLLCTTNLHFNTNLSTQHVNSVAHIRTCASGQATADTVRPNSTVSFPSVYSLLTETNGE